MEGPVVLPCSGLTSLFYSEELDDELAAKEICITCPRRAPCLRKALERDERDGVWGGMTPIERRFWVLEWGTFVEDNVQPLGIKLYSQSARA